MDLIGGGAKNYTDFLKFLGDKKLLGSPFQMNFPRPKGRETSGMKAMMDTPKQCNDTDQAYRCACVDCPDSCPALEELSKSSQCKVGKLPCLSFAVILVYSIFLLVCIAGMVFHVMWIKHTQRRSERLRLLQESPPSDDEDEGDMVHNAGMFERPQRSYKINTICDAAFGRLGSICARYPGIVIGSSILLVGLLSLGWINFSIETDPVRLWVSPSSAAAEEKQFYDSNFGPFYRAQQAFLVNDTNPGGPGPVLSYETLSWWFRVENLVQRISASKGGVTYDDVCFKPTGDACVTQSISGYFPGGLGDLDPKTWQKRVEHCTDSPVECLPAFQQPIDKSMILGGYGNRSVLTSEALIVTWVVNNHPQGTDQEARAIAWEESLQRLLKDAQMQAKEKGLRLSFSTESSLEEELNKSTNTDAKIVVISYIIMFIYASLALGSTTVGFKTLLNQPAVALVQSKFSLGVIGIVIVLMSVSASVGLFSAASIKVTLIIAEVIPFLVLAVGVDNIFLIVHEFERVNLSHPDEPVEQRIAKALGRMGPSILLSASTETIAFALGAFAGMPAVRNFAIYAAGAVFINALLQITMFVSVLALNQRRVEDHRADCFPCVQVAKSKIRGASGSYDAEVESSLQKFIRKIYAPALLQKKTKAIVIVIFLGLFSAGVSLMPAVPLGLDQRIAIPSSSYLIDYFNDLYAYFGVGPPVYFVTREVNATERAHQQQLCGRFTTCEEYSLANILEQERKRSDVSFLAEPTASWIDDYMTWLNPSLEDCCVEDHAPCFATRDPPWNTTLSGMPEGQEFIDYLDKWIRAPTTSDCPLAGKAAYSNALVIDTKRKTIPASSFRSSHTPLRSQEDFIEAYAQARRISTSISESTGIEVFPYSKFYIFFDQYSTIVHLTATLLGSALALIFLISSILLGSMRTGLVVTITVIMIVVDVIGTMAVAGVSLNAVSLVNLVICVGIGVEFCAHVARAFMFPSRSVMERAKNKFRGRDARAWTALVNVGGSVFSGITITKLLGVFVLAFTRSKIFEIYYFRIWLALVVFAASHALIFLPVALSIFGGDG
jgi:Niemann-Pick C1 protein